MKCIHHTSNDAVAICCGCGMALCAGCLRLTSDQETVCSQQCANRLKVRTVAQSALIAEVAVKLRSYRSLVLLFRLLGGISFLLGLSISFVELVATNFNRIPMVETIILTFALLGVSAVSTVGARALDRQIRETQELLGGKKNCGVDSELAVCELTDARVG